MSTKLHFGSVPLGHRPEIVGVVADFFPIDKLKSISDLGISILELRVDLISNSVSEITDYINLIRSLNKFALLLTIRKTPENESLRLSLFKQLIPLVDGVDVDVNTDICTEIKEYTKDEKKLLVVSYHNFERTPVFDELLEITKKANLLQADIIKIATMPNEQSDVLDLLAFPKKADLENFVIISMGEIGRISRAIAPLFGSLFTYSSIGDAVAPGQFSVEELSEILGKLYCKQ
jgi:3-dehydroquinate dehydratase I